MITKQLKLQKLKTQIPTQYKKTQKKLSPNHHVMAIGYL